MRLAMASSTKTLKIRIVSRKTDPSTSELDKPFPNRSKKTELVVVKRCGPNGSEETKAVTAGDGKQMKSICGIKRGAEGMIDHRSGKRLKMDRIMVRKCLLILKKLMTHQYGPGFNKPVDPVALNIPDYFSVISKPMDLGTIKLKLEKDRYATADEFEADVRLTFSNAMLYNPPQNLFHRMAQELNSLFSAQWRFLGSMMQRESMKSEADNGLCQGEKKLVDMKSDCQRMCTPNAKESPRRSIPATQNMNFKGSKQEAARKVPAKNVRAIEEEKKQVKKTVSKLSGSSAVSIGGKSLVNMETASRSSMNSDVLHRRPTESTNKMEPKKKEAAIGKKVPLSRARTSELKAPSSDLKTSEKIVDAVATDCKPSKACDSRPASRGSSNWLDEEPTSVNHQTTFASTALASDGQLDWRSPVGQTQLSPGKASRAEMLKRRFAGTILKAQNHTLLCPGEQVIQGKMEVEKQRLERHHAEENLMKTEVQASRDRKGFDHKSRMQHQREREAARIALEKMEKSVEFEDNISILKDLESMIGDYSFAGPLRGYSGMYVAAKQFVNGKLKSPLERLGLYLKEEDDYLSGDDQGHDRDTLPEDYEEGELLEEDYEEGELIF